MKSKKTLLYSSIAAVAVIVIAVLLVILLGNRNTYRTIEVHELNGTTMISDKKQESEAFVGQHLQNGTSANVSEASDITLLLDLDKYVYADALTHFWLEAKGKENSTKTVIHVDDGDTLFYLKEKLGESESFDVDTPASTMAVRGTVFRVWAYIQDGYQYTQLDVLQGRVEVSLHTTSGDNNGVVKTFEAGQSAIMRADDSMSEFIYEGKIDYPSIPQNIARYIGTIIDGGETLSIGKDLLFDYVGLIDHDWQEQILKEATCTSDGKAVKVCSICNAKQEEYVLKAYNHSETDWVVNVEPTCLEEGSRDKVCKLCGEVLETESLQALGHSFSTWETVLKPTCVKKGSTERVCSLCKEKESKSLAALGHTFGEYIIDKQPTCTENGVKTRVCSVCQEKDSLSIPAKGHDMSGWITDSYPDCGHSGFEHCECSVCGHREFGSTPATGNHSWSCSHGSWTMLSQTEEYRVITATCSSCGATDSTTQTHAFGSGAMQCPYCGSWQ